MYILSEHIVYFDILLCSIYLGTGKSELRITSVLLSVLSSYEVGKNTDTSKYTFCMCVWSVLRI